MRLRHFILVGYGIALLAEALFKLFISNLVKRPNSHQVLVKPIMGIPSFDSDQPGFHALSLTNTMLLMLNLIAVASKAYAAQSLLPFLLRSWLGNNGMKRKAKSLWFANLFLSIIVAINWISTFRKKWSRRKKVGFVGNNPQCSISGRGQKILCCYEAETKDFAISILESFAAIGPCRCQGIFPGLCPACTVQFTAATHVGTSSGARGSSCILAAEEI